MTFIHNTGNALLDPLINLWNDFVQTIPGLVAAIVVFALGYIVASAFGFVVHRLFSHAKLDEHVKRAGVAHSIGFINLSDLASGLMKWYVFALFLVPVAGLLNLGFISELLRDFALWIPHLVAAIIIMLVGLIISDYLADRMLHAKRKGVRFLSTTVRWFLILFVGLTALRELGIDVTLATNTTLILVSGFALGLTIAVGIGFGFAMKEEAKSAIKTFKKGLL